MTNALIIIAQGSEELEAITAADLLRRGGVKVTIAALNQDKSLELKCAHGTCIKADTILDNVVNESFDAIVIPGGLDGSINCGQSKLLIERLRKQQQDQKLIAAICAAPGFVLGANGFLNKKMKVACYPGCEKNEANYVADAVVIDKERRIITGRGPAYAIRFALAVLTYLTSEENAQKVANGMLLNE